MEITLTKEEQEELLFLVKSVPLVESTTVELVLKYIKKLQNGTTTKSTE